MIPKILWTAMVAVALCVTASAETASPPNVLFIAIHEFHDLAADPKHEEVKTRLAQWNPTPESHPEWKSLEEELARDGTPPPD